MQSWSADFRPMGAFGERKRFIDENPSTKTANGTKPPYRDESRFEIRLSKVKTQKNESGLNDGNQILRKLIQLNDIFT